MVRLLALSAVDHEFEPDRVKQDYKIGFWCFSTKHTALRRKTGWLRIRITCPSVATCLTLNVVSMS
jgi:hypothetical protein